MTVTAPSADELRRMMTDQLTATGALRSQRWIDAFTSVPRHVFVPRFVVRAQDSLHEYDQADPAWLTAAYRDTSLLTQFDAAGTATSSSTRPSLMAKMLEALDVEDGNRVLEIGVGTGYNAALLAHRLGSDRVVSVDVDPALVSAAQNRLGKTGFMPKLITGDGMAGCAEHAPYERLLATCGVGRVPASWREQVRPGGIIVANVGYGIARLTVDRDRRASGPFLPEMAAFMRARSGTDSVSATAQQLTRMLVTQTGSAREIDLPTSLGAEMAQFLPNLVHPTVETITLKNDAGRETHCLWEPRTSSWARITLLDVRTAHLDHGGPRDLWAEREPLLTHWVNAGRPGIDRYGLTVWSDGTHTLWLDDPANTAGMLPALW
ncbi:methyltransferase domain-containing protein [Streptomyces sp. NPDC051662]|uniref:methyltransferase domain-containing protein n=1 Tax=Streptomyces sp. NPDC051662 TaxID=3154750 RepID=UPI0034302AA4